MNGVITALSRYTDCSSVLRRAEHNILLVLEAANDRMHRDGYAVWWKTLWWSSQMDNATLFEMMQAAVFAKK